MRVLIISDVHANRRGRRALLDAAGPAALATLRRLPINPPLREALGRIPRRARRD